MDPYAKSVARTIRWADTPPPAERRKVLDTEPATAGVEN
jgi:hypothetical protein